MRASPGSGTNSRQPEAASVDGSITAVSRIPNSMEVWWVGIEASVQGAYWYEGQPWKQYELAPAGSASGSITAVSRIPDSMEVWWVGTDASVRDAFWYAPSHPYHKRPRPQPSTQPIVPIKNQRKERYKSASDITLAKTARNPRCRVIIAPRTLACASCNLIVTGYSV